MAHLSGQANTGTISTSSLKFELKLIQADMVNSMPVSNFRENNDSILDV